MPKQTFFNLDQQKQERILNAALEEFALNLFEKVTIDNIVKKAGIPKGSFYHYFENKEDVYQYLFESLVSQKNECFKRSLSELNNKSFSEMIRELYFAGIDFDFQDSTYVGLREKFLYNCSAELREEILERMIQDSDALFKKVLRYYVVKGELKEDLNVNLVAEMFTTLTIFLSKRLKSEQRKSREYIIDTMEEMIRIIEKGIERG